MLFHLSKCSTCNAKKIMMNTPNTTTRSVFYYSLWDPTLKYQINSIEMVQHQAIRFICNLKGREIISAAADKLKINTLKERRKGNRHSLLQIRSKEDNNHQALANSYDKLIKDRLDDIAITRAASNIQQLYTPNHLHITEVSYQKQYEN